MNWIWVAGVVVGYLIPSLSWLVTRLIFKFIK